MIEFQAVTIRRFPDERAFAAYWEYFVTRGDMPKEAIESLLKTGEAKVHSDDGFAGEVQSYTLFRVVRGET